MERLFIAIELPDKAKKTVLQAQEQVRAQMRRSSVSWVKAENFHITLHFLGDIDEIRRDLLVENLEKAGFVQPFELVLDKVSAFPNKKRPRTIFVDTKANPAVFGLRKNIADVLANMQFDLDTRAWQSHVTIGRVKVRSEVLQPEKIRVEAVRFDVDSFHLVRSTLTEQGSIYETVNTFEL